MNRVDSCIWYLKRTCGMKNKTRQLDRRWTSEINVMDLPLELKLSFDMTGL